MAREDDARARWDARHAAAGAPRPPDAFVAHALDALARGGAPRGRALELACGTGRHALALAERGYQVEAWDLSPVALERLAEEARARRLAVRTRALDLEDAAELERALAATRAFELVCAVDYLHRPLLARLAELVAPGGHALLATFTTDRAGEHPSARFCLAPFELARGLPGFATVLAGEARGRAGLLARRR